ncbi:MAG: Gfo/Idh/MocA family oxidoreductase [Dehalococcoidia bacterium]
MPNITVVPNLVLPESSDTGLPLMTFGCTMGHYHPGDPSEFRIQEVYEFQSYGLMLLDREQGEIELWVARDGDKISVPNQCHMTLYNLGGKDDPLITLDFANPDRNPDDGKAFIREYGPALLAYYDGSEAVFTLNRLHVNNPEHYAGVNLILDSDDLEARQVKIPLGTRIDLGRPLYNELTRNLDVIGRFARLGIQIRAASSEASVEPVSDGSGQHDRRIYFAAPLVDATTEGTEVYRYFFPESEAVEPAPPQRNMAAEERRLAPQRNFGLERLERPLFIVVEGAGLWVQAAYRSAFVNLARPRGNDNFNIFVVYADDTRWTNGKSPDFVKSLNPWELYLDKANALDLELYQNLNPDVVFIVTPDFTHSELAIGWINKSPLVLIEKPFDSSLENMDRLIGELGLSNRSTLVLGLDHYRSYAYPLTELLPTIADHLGGALRQVCFYMTEDKGIEQERAQSVQFGLTLDMLPHFFALLQFFGHLESVDSILVSRVGQYDPLPIRFDGDTAAVSFACCKDYSGNGHLVPCLAVVGKGFSQEVKLFEAVGINGNSIRIDLGGESLFGDWPAQDVNDPYDPGRMLPQMRKFQGEGYRRNSILFLQAPDNQLDPASIYEVTDPYDSQGRQLHLREDIGWKSLDRGRYEALVRDLLDGTNTGFGMTMSLAQSRQLMIALERTWRAVQADRPKWQSYQKGTIDPVPWAPC